MDKWPLTGELAQLTINIENARSTTTLNDFFCFVLYAMHASIIAITINSTVYCCTWQD